MKIKSGAMPKIYCIRYADGHLGEPRTWESVLFQIATIYRRLNQEDLQNPESIPVRVEHRKRWDNQIWLKGVV
jgi:hypothetical protein